MTRPESPSRAASAPTPTVSVIVPAFNAEAHILDALQSVVGQEGAFELEIIVVDDGSADGTRALVKSFGGVRLFSQANAGPSAARNLGIAKANGEFIAFLDADDVWPPGKLAAQFALFEAHPEVGLVFGDCQIFSERGQQPKTLFQSENLGPAFWGDGSVVVDPYKKLFRVNFIPTGSVLVRRRCFDEVGMFDESRRLVEDKELWFRFALQCQLGVTPKLCELKREHDSNVSSDREGMALAHISLLREQKRDHPAEIRYYGINVRKLIAYEYSILGDRRERRGDIKRARYWYSKAFAAYPSIRPLYYWLRTWV